MVNFSAVFQCGGCTNSQRGVQSKSHSVSAMQLNTALAMVKL
jgi:hypothetical protein